MSADDPFCPRHGRRSRPSDTPGLRCDCHVECKHENIYPLTHAVHALRPVTWCTDCGALRYAQSNDVGDAVWFVPRNPPPADIGADLAAARGALIKEGMERDEARADATTMAKKWKGVVLSDFPYCNLCGAAGRRDDDYWFEHRADCLAVKYGGINKPCQ